MVINTTFKALHDIHREAKNRRARKTFSRLHPVPVLRSSSADVLSTSQTQNSTLHTPTWVAHTRKCLLKRRTHMVRKLCERGNPAMFLSVDSFKGRQFNGLIYIWNCKKKEKKKSSCTFINCEECAFYSCLFPSFGSTCGAWFKKKKKKERSILLGAQEIFLF